MLEISYLFILSFAEGNYAELVVLIYLKNFSDLYGNAILLYRLFIFAKPSDLSIPDGLSNVNNRRDAPTK